MSKQTITFTTNIDVYSSQEDLPQDEKALVLKAREAMDTAYSPYSHFCVGAAVLLKNGETVQGSNQENAAYGPTNCAERSALFAVGSQGKKDQVAKIAVIARHESHKTTALPVEQEKNGTPCGVCRQVMKEYEVLAGQKIVILCVFNTDRIYRFDGIETLLPLGFGPSALQ